MAYPYTHSTLPLDLHVYLAGGTAVLRGSNLYSSAVAVRGYGFTYPPFAALLFAGMSGVSASAAEVVTIFAFFLALKVVVSKAAPGLLGRAADSWSGTLLLTVMLTVQPTWATLHDGQINMVLAAVLLFDLARPRRSDSQGLLTGVCAAVKLTPAVFIVYLLITRRWRAASNAVLGFVAATCLAWVIVPADSRTYWCGALLETSRVGATSRVSNQSLLGLASREVPGAWAAHLCWLAALAVVLPAGLSVARRIEAGGQQVLALALVGVTGCLISPISWTHHWVWFIPLLGGVHRSPVWHRRRCRVATYAVSVVFLVGATRWAALPLGGPRSPASDSFVLAGLLAIGGLAWATRKVSPERATSVLAWPLQVCRSQSVGGHLAVRGVHAAKTHVAAAVRRRAVRRFKAR